MNSKICYKWVIRTDSYDRMFLILGFQTKIQLTNFVSLIKGYLCQSFNTFKDPFRVFWDKLGVSSTLPRLSLGLVWGSKPWTRNSVSGRRRRGGQGGTRGPLPTARRTRRGDESWCPTRTSLRSSPGTCLVPNVEWVPASLPDEGRRWKTLRSQR